MLLSLLILLPLWGIFMIFILNTEKNYLFSDTNDMLVKKNEINIRNENEVNDKTLKVTALVVTVIDLFLSLVI
jgi:hypothetical protein